MFNTLSVTDGHMFVNMDQFYGAKDGQFVFNEQGVIYQIHVDSIIWHLQKSMWKLRCDRLYSVGETISILNQLFISIQIFGKVTELDSEIIFALKSNQ